MQHEDKDKLNELLNEFAKNNPIKLSNDFDKNFEHKLAQSKKRFNLFSKPTFKYAIASLLIFFIAIYYFNLDSNSTFSPAEQQTALIDSSNNKTIDTVNVLKEIEKATTKLVATNFDPKNFENNSILEGYYGQMRSNLTCEVVSPVLADKFKYNKKGTKITFEGIVFDSNEQDLELIISFYIGNNQKAVLKNRIKLNENQHFSFTNKFELPGQYSWKVVAENEIIFAGNFFIGKLPAK
jgi:hypothetical protein